MVFIELPQTDWMTEQVSVPGMACSRNGMLRREKQSNAKIKAHDYSHSTTSTDELVGPYKYAEFESL